MKRQEERQLLHEQFLPKASQSTANSSNKWNLRLSNPNGADARDPWNTDWNSDINKLAGSSILASIRTEGRDPPNNLLFPPAPSAGIRQVVPTDVNALSTETRGTAFSIPTMYLQHYQDRTPLVERMTIPQLQRQARLPRFEVATVAIQRPHCASAPPPQVDNVRQTRSEEGGIYSIGCRRCSADSDRRACGANAKKTSSTV